jgi:hypothetical protein
MLLRIIPRTNPGAPSRFAIDQAWIPSWLSRVIQTLVRSPASLLERACSVGAYLRERLHDALSGYEMVEQVRGMGMLNGIVFRAPRKLTLRVPFETFLKIHPAMFGQLAVMRLFGDEKQRRCISSTNGRNRGHRRSS